MPIQVVISQMPRGLRRALGEIEEVQVDLHGRDAAQAITSLLAGEYSGVVGAEDLHVGPFGSLTDAELLDDIPWISVDVDRGEPEAREAIDCPGGGYDLALTALAHARAEDEPSKRTDQIGDLLGEVRSVQRDPQPQASLAALLAELPA